MTSATFVKTFAMTCITVISITSMLVACGTPKPAPAKAPLLPASLRPYIDEMSRPIALQELPDYVKGDLPQHISKAEALHDIDVLAYLLDNAYSGRYYWQQQGVDFVAAYQTLRQFVQQQSDTVDTKSFEDAIYQSLQGINDPHTAIIGHETAEFFTRIRQYFSNFVVEKQGDRYMVVDSSEPGIVKGMEYTGAQTSLFPTLSPTGRQHFLFGQMSTSELTQLSAQFKQGRYNVTVHPCRIGEIKYDRFNDIIDTREVNDVTVVRSSSFWVEGKIKELEAFSEMGKSLRDKPYFVWDLLANDGGITQYPAAFIENFNDFQQDESWEVHLYSTPIAQAYFPGKNTWSSWPAAWLDDNTPIDSIPEYKRAHVLQVRQQKIDLIKSPRRYWQIVREKPEKKMGSYKGKAVILSNYRNGSAGNNALAMSKSIPNSIIVGENSNMTYAFANTRNFSLKYSRIKLRLPGRLIINPHNSIERGFLPDYWLDSATPVDEVTRWLQTPAHYQFHYQ